MVTSTGTSSWDHVEILAAVVSHLPGERFQASRPNWQAAVAEMKQTFPDLLTDVFFTRRDPLAPYSSQVDEFLKMLDKSDHASLPNPVYRVREISDASKSDLRRRYGRKLKAVTPQIQEMSKILTKHIKVEA